MVDIFENGLIFCFSNEISFAFETYMLFSAETNLGQRQGARFETLGTQPQEERWEEQQT